MDERGLKCKKVGVVIKTRKAPYKFLLEMDWRAPHMFWNQIQLFQRNKNHPIMTKHF